MKRKLMVFADGTSVHTEKWIEGLSYAGIWDLYLLTMNPEPTRPGIARLPGFKKAFQIAPRAVKESGNNYQYLFHLPEIRRVVREVRPDVITTVYLTSYGLIGALTRGSARLAHFVVGNDIMIFPDQGLVQRMMTAWTLARADFVVSASRTMTDRLTGPLKVPADRILTQQYGVGDWVIQYPAKEKLFDLVSNRAWIPNSNIDYFLEVLNDVPGLRTALIGDTVAGSEPLGQKIASLAGGISGVKRFRSLPYEDNIKTVAQSRFLVSLTTSDGASLSVMEAMAMGVVPILSDTAPNREWVNHGENGFLLPLGDRATATLRLRQAAAVETDQWRAMSDRCRAIIQQRGSLRANMGRVSDRLLALYQAAPPKGQDSDLSL